jgi:hypothetical protein
MAPHKKLFFILAFTLLALVASQFQAFPLLGIEGQKFTLFEFFGPTAGAFLGLGLGGILVFAASIAALATNVFVLGKSASLFSVLRLFPMLFALAYFGSRTIRESRLVSAVPIACMALFWLHPVGAQAWAYALYWLIPLIATLKPSLISRSLGATFTAHAIGSVAFLYTLPSAPALWIGLLPIVALERGLFSFGIASSYIVFNTTMAKLRVPVFQVDRRYVLSKIPALG